MAAVATWQEIEVRPADGWAPMITQATSRNLSWEDICSELIDNASAFRSDEACLVRFTWGDSRNRFFSCEDNGRGCADPQSFLSPGKSDGRALEHGSSTFGTGLYAVEGNLDGQMVITTRCGDESWKLRRTFKHGLNAKITQTAKASQGTLVAFSRIAEKRSMPQARTIKERIAVELGKRYGKAIRDGLTIELCYRGNSVKVGPCQLPAGDMQQAIVEHDGHQFELRWCFCEEPQKTPGVSLTYGGKHFATTSIPCGDYNVTHFYGDITIPRSFGKEAMDFLKRDIDTDSMRAVYDRAAELFDDCLKRSDEKYAETHSSDLDKELARLLFGGQGAKKKTRGDEDLREFSGRDMSNNGAEPKDTGRKRKGRSGKRGAGTNPDIQWQPLGADDETPAADYQPASSRLTFNEDNGKLVEWRKDGQKEKIAVVGAAFIADATRNREVGYGTFGFQMNKVLERLA